MLNWAQIWYVYISHCRKNLINFGECWMLSFFTGVQKYSYALCLMRIKFFKMFSYLNGAFDWAQIWYAYQRLPSFTLHDFGEFKINTHFTGLQKRTFKHYSLWYQITGSVLVSKGFFRLISNLMRTFTAIGNVLKNG